MRVKGDKHHGDDVTMRRATSMVMNSFPIILAIINMMQDNKTEANTFQYYDVNRTSSVK